MLGVFLRRSFWVPVANHHGRGVDEVLGLVTARGGSHGIPGKNLAPLCGTPLIAWTIQAAMHAGEVNRVVLSTDDSEIAEVASTYGAEVPFLRPRELARDDSPHIDAVIHALRMLEESERYCPEYTVVLQPTSPLRIAEDIDRAVDVARKQQAPAVVSVTTALHHPYLVKRLGPDGHLRDFVDTPDGYLRRQDLLEAYALNGAIYLIRSEAAFEQKTLMPPGTVGYVMPQERSLDIDTPWDLKLAEYILSGARPPTPVC